SDSRSVEQTGPVRPQRRVGAHMGIAAAAALTRPVRSRFLTYAYKWRRGKEGPLRLDSPPSSERRDPPPEWGALVEHYGRPVWRWFRQHVASEADARELTRGWFAHLARQARAAPPPESGPRFRDWLRGAAHLAWSELRAARSERPALGVAACALLQAP